MRINREHPLRTSVLAKDCWRGVELTCAPSRTGQCDELGSRPFARRRARVRGRYWRLASLVQYGCKIFGGSQSHEGADGILVARRSKNIQHLVFFSRLTLQGLIFTLERDRRRRVWIGGINALDPTGGALLTLWTRPGALAKGQPVSCDNDHRSVFLPSPCDFDIARRQRPLGRADGLPQGAP